MTQFGLMFLLFVITWFRPRSRYESTFEKTLDVKTDKWFMLMSVITLMAIKLFILWHVAGVLLPYIHMYLPLN